jgi:hypothetical protein
VSLKVSFRFTILDGDLGKTDDHQPSIISQPGDLSVDLHRWLCREGMGFEAIDCWLAEKNVFFFLVGGQLGSGKTTLYARLIEFNDPEVTD